MSSIVKDSVFRARQRFKRVTNTVYIVGFLGHTGLFVYFYYFNVLSLACFNLFISAPVFTAALILNQKNYPNLAFSIAIIELIVHQIFAIMILGWGSGFQFILVYTVTLSFVNINWKRTTNFFVVFSVCLAFSLLYLNPELISVSQDMPPVGYLKELYLANAFTTLILISITTGYFIRTTNISEYELEEMVNKRTKELQTSQKAAIEMLGDAGHFHDTDTGDHIWRMARYAGLLAQKRGWSSEDILNLELAAAMHDTGKIGIKESILQKPGKLDANEWREMQTHTQIGADILKRSDAPLFKLASDIALNHHEKWDGSGYPNGYKQFEISEAARIVAIADVFDALTTQRPYKKAWSFDEAFAELKRSAGSHFDPEMIEQFIELRPEIEYQ